MNAYFSVRDSLGRSTLPGFNINIRRKVFEETGGFKDVPLEDIELSINLRKIGSIRYFTDFYVITSSRRLEKMGLLGSIRYYIEMDLARKNPVFRDLLAYSDYFSCRIKNAEIQKGFKRSFMKAEQEPPAGILVNDYIREVTEPIARIKNLPPRKLLRQTFSTAASLADIKFKDLIEKIDVDNAVQLIREKIKNLKEKTHLKAR